MAKAFIPTSSIPLRIIEQKENGGLSLSYNTGAELSKTDIIVFIHSDSVLPTSSELRKLVHPLIEYPNAIASSPMISIPESVWNKFPFWQKFMFAPVAARPPYSCMCGKFDCFRRSIYLNVGGFGGKHFTPTCGYDGEDSDLINRLRNLGTIVKTTAHVIHLHVLTPDFHLSSVLRTRKFMARTYGKIIQFQGLSPIHEKIGLFAKPFLSIVPFPPLWLIFSLVYSKQMYFHKSTLFNPRILLVPILDIFLIYYETFWFIEGWIAPPVDAK
jgi:glycosyltransferase involved in cell wall biosynthesis